MKNGQITIQKKVERAYIIFVLLEPLKFRSAKFWGSSFSCTMFLIQVYIKRGYYTTQLNIPICFIETWQSFKHCAVTHQLRKTYQLHTAGWSSVAFSTPSPLLLFGPGLKFHTLPTEIQQVQIVRTIEHKYAELRLQRLGSTNGASQATNCFCPKPERQNVSLC